MADETRVETIGAGSLPTQSGTLQAAAQAVISAFSQVGGDAGCAQLASGSGAVYDAVHAFKVAWNTEGYGVDPVPGGTASTDSSFDTVGPLSHNGLYDGPCAAAITATGAGSYPACAGGGGGGGGGGGNQPNPAPLATTGGMPKWLKVILAVVAAAAVIFAGVMIYKGSKKRGSHGASEAPRRRKKRRKKARRKSKRR